MSTDIVVYHTFATYSNSLYLHFLLVELQSKPQTERLWALPLAGLTVSLFLNAATLGKLNKNKSKD